MAMNGTTKSADNYLLSRDRLASSRLMLQHTSFIRYQGWYLHPTVEKSVQNKPNLRVADLATGNGIWLLELSDEYPEAELVGFDISDAQFPTRTGTPDNVRFELGNLFDPVPEKYQNYFDIVHIRIVVAAIYGKDKHVLMKNIISMIKPGGYLQWDELKYPIVHVVDKDLKRTEGEVPTTTQILEMANFREAVEWAVRLPEVFKQHALIDVIGHEPTIKRSNLALSTAALLWSTDELMEFAVKAGKPGAVEARAASIAANEKMIRDGYCYAYAWIVAVGKKPEA